MARPIILFTFVFITITRGSVLAQDPLPVEPLDHNAALSYWQAFALLPQISEEKRDLLASCVSGESPIDDVMRGLVAESENSLRYLHRGAEINSCGWGLAYEYGPFAYLPHLAKARELARVALLRARIRFQSGMMDEGMDDTVAAIQLGRHAGQQGVIVLINILVGFAIEAEAIDTIGDSLHLMSAAQRGELQKQLDQIEPTIDMKTALQGEKDVFLGWVIREFEGGASSERIMELVSGEPDKKITDRIEKASQDQLLTWAKALSAIYDQGQAMMSLAPDEATEAGEKLITQLRETGTGNPLGELFLPSFASARRAEAIFETRKQLLKAAFAIFESGSTALNRPDIGDPYGEGAFELQRIEDGAELISELERGGTAIKLRILGLPE